MPITTARLVLGSVKLSETVLCFPFRCPLCVDCLVFFPGSGWVGISLFGKITLNVFCELRPSALHFMLLNYLLVVAGGKAQEKWNQTSAVNDLPFHIWGLVSTSCWGGRVGSSGDVGQLSVNSGRASNLTLQVNVCPCCIGKVIV